MSDSLQSVAAPTTSVKPQRVCVLLNASSGTFAGKSQEEFETAIVTAFRRNGIVAHVQFLAGGDLQGAAEHALLKVKDHEADAIAVGGGDGTISTVAGVLANSGVPMGIIPLGTLNHFAKDLGIPLSIDEAVGTIATGHTRHVDVGEANGRVFVNNSSIGVYPYMVMDRERRRRSGLPKWLAMIPAALRTIWNLPLRRLSVSAGGWTTGFRTPCVFIGNNQYTFNGASMGGRDHLDGGRLCLYIARSQSRGALLLLVLRSLLMVLDTAKDLQSIQLQAFEIRSRRKRLLVSFDGEIEFFRTPLNYTIRAGALRVFAAPHPQ